jgi:hypothetical protein
MDLKLGLEAAAFEIMWPFERKQRASSAGALPYYL